MLLLWAVGGGLATFGLKGQNGLAMVGSAAQPQSQQKLVFCAGPSDPTNGSRRSEASNSELPDDNKAFRPQFDDQRE